MKFYTQKVKKLREYQQTCLLTGTFVGIMITSCSFLINKLSSDYEPGIWMFSIMSIISLVFVVWGFRSMYYLEESLKEAMLE